MPEITAGRAGPPKLKIGLRHTHRRRRLGVVKTADLEFDLGGFPYPPPNFLPLSKAQSMMDRANVANGATGDAVYSSLW